MAFNLIARKPEFEAYVGPLLARPARKRADALIQELMAKDVVAAL
jgi:hypothetical protein